MAEFGWAYVGEGNGLTDVPGPSGSVLLKKTQNSVTGSPDLIFNTGSGVLEIDGGLSASANISASYFYGDGSNLTNLPHAEQDLDSVLTAGNTSALSMSVNSVTSSTANFTGLSAGTAANTSSYLALDSNNNVILTSSAGGGGSATGVIGEAEDGDYTDGLYTDFTPTTPIGTAIDRFNEILKILSPPITPSVQTIDYDQSDGISAKLSFDDSYPITDYTASSTEGGFDAVARNAVYEAEVSGSNYRLGIYNAQTFTGTVNYNITQNSINSNIVYTDDAFGQANNGTLKLELNGTVIHSVDLSSFLGSGDPGTGSADSLTSNSGFIDVSVTASTIDGNGNAWTQYQYRTAKYQIDSGDQNKGWNYLRIIHTIGSSNYSTNYIEWINDPDGAASPLSISNERIEDITTNGTVYLSGVRYNTEITASYKAEINNIYRNVFPTGTPISFTATNATTPSAQSVPDLGIGEDETKSLPITASFNLQGTLNPSQTIGLGVNVTHPLKVDLSNAGAATATEFLIFDDTPPVSSNTVETFIDEDRRLVSASYDTQASVIGIAFAWDSTVHMLVGAGDQQDGLLQIGTAQYSGRLYSPIDADLPNSGDFSILSNGFAGNPDYSGVTGTRTWFRKIQNTQLYDVYNMLISTTKTSTTFNNSSLGTGNLNVYIKIPETSGWMDISQNFSYGNISDGDGALISSAANDTDSGNNSHYITFGTASIASTDYVVLKIVGDASWAGYIDQISFTLPANQNQATPQVLSDINGAVTGIEANLSFGTSNNITDYSNVTGSATIGTDDINSNQLYNLTDNRRGIFSSSIDLNGTINDAIGAGSGYPVDAFYNGYSGSLILEVNGTEVHSVDLDNSLSLISSYNGNGSGFSLSAVSFSTLSGIPHYTKPYRTGTYQIDALDTNIGWNYARIIHRTSGDQTTNYVEWVIDPSGSTDDTSVSTPVLSDFNHNDIYYQSGIGYFASRPSASFSYTASNFYRNVYQYGTSITFPTIDNCSVTNTRVTGSGVHTTSSAVSSLNMPLLNNTTGCETTDIEITGTVLFDSLTSISGGLGLFTDYDVSVTGKVLHPFKSDRTTSAASKTSFMVYSGSNGSTNINTEEYFTAENYRIVSGNYANQAAVTSSANTWDSTISINDTASYAEYADGLVTVNGYAISPFEIGNAGDTRNNSEGTTGLQAPAGNPNYSALDITERTFYRYFKNTSGVLVFNPVRITLFGDATIIAANGTLGANKNIKVELKVPYDPSYTGGNDKSTGWCDVGSPYDDQQDLTVDGAGLYAGTLDSNVDSNGAQVNLNFQGKGIYNNQYFVVKITAHKDWTGYLSEIRMAYS